MISVEPEVTRYNDGRKRFPKFASNQGQYDRYFSCHSQ